MTLPLIGSSAFFPSFLSVFHATIPSLDPVIAQSILLCLISGNNHLILRSSEQDIALVVKSVALNQKNIVRYGNPRSPWCSSRITFLPLAASRPSAGSGLIAGDPQGSASYTAADCGVDELPTLSSIFHYQTHKLKIKPSSDPFIDSTGHFLRSLFLPTHHNKSKDTRSAPRSANGKHHHVHPPRSHSYPNELLEEGLPLDTKPVTADHPRIPSAKFKTKTSKSKLKSKFDHSHTDPTPTPTAPDGLSDPFQQTLELPRALVVSGLEHAGLPAQRALVGVLRERRVVLEGMSRFKGSAVGDSGRETSMPDADLNGVWDLPDGFIMVYVCPWDPRERPAIHKSLLDRFAMCSNITELHPSTRHALHSSFSFSNSSGSNFRPTSPSSSPGTPPLSAITVLHTLREYHKRVHLAPTLKLYTSDLFSAARHHPQLDGTLVGSRARTDADGLITATRLLGLDKEVTIPLVDYAGESEAESYGRHRSQEGETEAPVLDVSAADVRRIVPRVVSHRVRVRDRPEDEVLGSAVFGAVRSGEEREWERSTVKDILVQILAEV